MDKEILHTVRSVMGCMLVTALAAGCAQEDIGNAPSEGGGMSATSYVSLSFASPQGTPTRAGETGDGQETGQDKENAITSAVAFFYQGTDQKGVNSDGTTLIKAVVSFNNIGNGTDENSTGIDRKYTTTPQQVDLDDGTYNVIVVANPGMDWWTGRSLTLADVRDHIQTTAWTASESGYSNFVMTSAADATLTLNSNPSNAPAEATVNVERMAARLDYKTTGTYTCDDPDYESNNQKATVEITGAALVNNLTAGSYLLKRVADDVNISVMKHQMQEYRPTTCSTRGRQPRHRTTTVLPLVVRLKRPKIFTANGSATSRKTLIIGPLMFSREQK